jgi:alcohol dehydrogenase
MPTKIFLVADRDSYELSGAKDRFGKILKNYDVVHFSDFQLNPKLEDAVKGVDLYTQEGCNFVIAVGGGSSIDIAKLVRVFAANHGNPEDYVRKKAKLKARGNPLIAVPTTAGTGSESTQFAVVYIGKTKYSLDNLLVLPEVAIVDPSFTATLPPYQTASTGMDALSQAIESYWCIHSTDESKGYAREAIELAAANLVGAVQNPTTETRTAMSKAAHLAGKAINISRTTAPHAVSYPITSHFGVSHGHAVMLTLPGILIYNSAVAEHETLDSRGVGYVRTTMREIVALLGSSTAEGASQRIKSLMDDVELESRLSRLGITSADDVELIIKNGFNPDRVKNNPRRLTEEALRQILNDAI